MPCPPPLHEPMQREVRPAAWSTYMYLRPRTTPQGGPSETPHHYTNLDPKLPRPHSGPFSNRCYRTRESFNSGMRDRGETPIKSLLSGGVYIRPTSRWRELVVLS